MATGVVFVAIVLGTMLWGWVPYAIMLTVACVGCAWEFHRLAPRNVWGLFYIGVVIGMMLRFEPRFAAGFAVVVWANDVCAYLVGVTLGRHKMAPRLSPHKSWEGFVGGLVGAVVVATFVGRFWIGVEFDLPGIWGAFGLFVALAAVGGDLAESWFKRAAGVKDSGRVFPGHGGFLDRFDAMLGAAPVAFLFMMIFLR